MLYAKAHNCATNMAVYLLSTSLKDLGLHVLFEQNKLVSECITVLVVVIYGLVLARSHTYSEPLVREAIHCASQIQINHRQHVQ